MSWENRCVYCEEDILKGEFEIEVRDGPAHLRCHKRQPGYVSPIREGSK